MDGTDRPSDLDAAFLRLREVLGAPDRRGWRRFLARRPGGDAEGDLERARPRRPRIAALAALPLLGAAGVLLVSIARPPDPAPRMAMPPASSQRTDVAPVETPEPAPLPQKVWPGEEVMVDGEGKLRVGRQRWSVGAAGDVVVIGDWNCDRQPTPAVLRPDTGGFYVFDGWAAPGQPATARKVADVPQAISATSAGCGAAVVRTVDGEERRIATEAVR